MSTADKIQKYLEETSMFIFSIQLFGVVSTLIYITHEVFGVQW
jgi:hypothetical protein